MKKTIVLILSVMLMLGALGCIGEANITELTGKVEKMEEVLAESQLKAKRIKACNEIDYLLEEKSKDWYSPSKWNKIENVALQAKKEILHAETIEKVVSIAIQADTEIYNIPTMAQEFPPYSNLSYEVKLQIKADLGRFVAYCYYFGVHNGCMVFEYFTGNDVVSEELIIAGYSFRFASDSYWFYIWKPGGVYMSVENAYMRGYLNREDIGNIWQIRNNKHEYFK